MVATGLGALPGTDMIEAAVFVADTLGAGLYAPELPSRGLGFDPVGRTAGLLPALPVDRGPRGWQLTARPQRATHLLRDGIQRDLDALESVWGTAPAVVKTQVVGPWSLAAALELPNGHRAITDSGAVRDIVGAAQEGLGEHRAEFARRCAADVLVQVDEPLVGEVLRGCLPGAHRYEDIRAVPADVVAHGLASLQADCLYLPVPEWELLGLISRDPGDAGRPQYIQLCTPLYQLERIENADALGEHLDAGGRLGVVLPWREADEAGIIRRLVNLVELLGLPREIVARAFDIVVDAASAPDLSSAGKAYSAAENAAVELSRNAGF